MMTRSWIRFKLLKRLSDFVLFRIDDQSRRTTEFLNGLRVKELPCVKLDQNSFLYTTRSGETIILHSANFPEVQGRGGQRNNTLATRGSSVNNDNRELRCPRINWLYFVEAVCAYNIAGTNNTLSPGELAELTVIGGGVTEYEQARHVCLRLYGTPAGVQYVA